MAAPQAPKPAPRKVFTAPVPLANSDLKDEDLYGASDDELPSEVEVLRSEVKRLKERVATLEKQDMQFIQQSELITKQEREIEEQRRQLEVAKREAQKQQSELKAQEERLKQRDFQLEMEKDMHIRRKKAMDDKEFRIREMEDDLQSKIKQFSAATTSQNSSLEELARREEDVGIREVRLQRQQEELKSFQDALYEREGRLEQNERTLEEKYKNVIAMEQEIKDRLHALELQREEHVKSVPTTPIVKSTSTPTNTSAPASTSTPATTTNTTTTVTTQQLTTSTNTITTPATITHDPAEVNTQREIEEFYRLKREQEELDRLLALQFEQSGFGDDEIPPSISSSDAPDGKTDSTTGHSALDIANNS